MFGAGALLFAQLERYPKVQTALSLAQRRLADVLPELVDWERELYPDMVRFEELEIFC